MDEALADVGQAAQAIAGQVIYSGGNFSITISSSSAQSVKELCITAVSLGAMYAGYKLIAKKIDDAISRSLGGERDDQEIRDVTPDGENVSLQCFTDQRFLDVLEDFACGTMKERFDNEFSEIGIELVGLQVKINNIEEVEERKVQILMSKTKIENIVESVDINDESNTEEFTTESSKLWTWEKNSITHREKFIKLRECGREHPQKIEEINDVRVCFEKEFLVGKGSDATRVYVGLGKDGYEKAVKRLVRDDCDHMAEHEKKILNEPSVKESNHIVRYHYLDDKSNKDWVFLIMDLCEETLKDYVERSSCEEFSKVARPIIQQVLQGLVDLHSEPKCILHRDLKPSNILRNVHNKWLLADFGISRPLTQDESTFRSKERGTKDWKAVESCSENMPNDDEVRYKKESDIQVAGMVAFYVVTKGEHPFGEKPDRLRNLLHGKPIYLNKVKDPAAKDLISWMVSHNPKDRPLAGEAQKHPYLQPKKQQLKMLCEVGNQREVKTGDNSSDVVKELNSDPTDWKTLMTPDVLNYLCFDFQKERMFQYGSSWTECLRLIRNVNQHWKDQTRPLPQPEAFYIVGDPQEYFLSIFPNLPVVVHRIVRSCNWKERRDLKEYFT